MITGGILKPIAIVLVLVVAAAFIYKHRAKILAVLPQLP